MNELKRKRIKEKLIAIILIANINPKRVKNFVNYIKEWEQN